MTTVPVQADCDPAATTADERREHDMLRITKFMGLLVAVGGALLAARLWHAGGASVVAGLLWALALLTSGMAVGFLFGVPKVRQGAEAEGAGREGEPGAPRSAVDYQQRVNTNLEEISDWLTKILVGMGLVNLKELPAALWQLGRTVGDSLGTSGEQQGLGVALAVFFGVAGLLYGYLMTRLYLQGALARAEAGLTERLREVGAQLAAQRNDLRDVGQQAAAALAGVGQTAHAGRARETDAARLASASGALAVGLRRGDEGPPQAPAEGADVWRSDPHKGFAQGRSEDARAGRKLDARIVPIRGSEACRVHFELRATSPTKPLRGPVIFHLHPTFAQPDVTVSPDSDGVARLDVVATGAFTVGAQADDGQTRLELDLVHVTGGTDAFYAN